MLSFDLQLYLSFSVSVVEVSMKKVKLNEDMNISDRLSKTDGN
jgi:hypothetical protein